jgi:hypothetical protein|tara:strand:+ start:378 stop:641 length:264 start_codon:yes stop_codon:yes gene_type:complete
MNVMQIKNAMLKMSQTELGQIIHYANSIKSISANATFSVGQKVMVVQKTKQTSATIVKMNPKKARVEMMWQGRVAKVNVPYGMLEAA